MSTQGWQDFLAAQGVADWVVLHGGATAVFRVPTLGEAAMLAGVVAGLPGLDGSGVLMTIADDRLTVRLTRGVFRLEQRHIDLARAVSVAARKVGAVADRASTQEVSLAIAAKPDAIDVGFWRTVLGYAPRPTITRSTRWATARRSGCRSSTPTSRSGTRCTSTCPSLVNTSRGDWRPRSLQAVTSCGTPTRPVPGSSPTAPETASALSPGRMGRSRPHLFFPSSVPRGVRRSAVIARLFRANA